MNQGAMIKFAKEKYLKYEKPLGRGGTGDTHLFFDTTTDMHFAIKKYLPHQKEYREELYLRFVNEIKILLNISHPNIVRIYNYYLYPESYVGYLQMEYIDGTTIDKHDTFFCKKEWDVLFLETILAFRHLEQKNILHRDIKASNIMITHNEDIKIIDFGFSKVFPPDEKNENSVYLNWDVSELPKEIVVEGDYNLQSEIFFLGKLFEKILSKNECLNNFKYKSIIDKMVKKDPDSRYKSFSEIEQEAAIGLLASLNFSAEDKQKYIKFANYLEDSIKNYTTKLTFKNDMNLILNNLSKIIKENCLENYIQHNQEVIDVFINCNYIYKRNINIPIDSVKTFYLFLYNLNESSQITVLKNLQSRLSTIKTIEEEEEAFPF